jgi:hypothetical protein
MLHDTGFSLEFHHDPYDLPLLVSHPRATILDIVVHLPLSRKSPKTAWLCVRNYSPIRSVSGTEEAHAGAVAIATAHLPNCSPRPMILRMSSGSILVTISMISSAPIPQSLLAGRASFALLQKLSV